MSPKPPPENADKEHDEGDGDEEQRQKQLEVPLDEFPLKVALDIYTNNMEYSISDHKPVTGIFRLEVMLTLLLPVALHLYIMIHSAV